MSVSIKCILFFILIGFWIAVVGCLVPDTGQMGDYTPVFGEDSDYTRFPPSYTKLDATGAELPDDAAEWAMIKDYVTGLVWEKKTDDSSIHNWEQKYTWQGAQDVFIEQLNEDNFGGFNDWRLPNAKELLYIANRNGVVPSIDDTYFPLTNWIGYYGGYWTITEYSGNPLLAYFVGFDYGAIRRERKSNEMYVRAVRGESITNQILEDNGDGTATDWGTSLMWEQHGNDHVPRGYWESALDYCEELSLAGHDDWRLPNVNELTSLVDFSRNDPSINTDFFPVTVSDYYWSSTSIPRCIVDDSAAIVSFKNGSIVYSEKSNGGYSQKHWRCVRSIKYTTYPTQ